MATRFRLAAGPAADVSPALQSYTHSSSPLIRMLQQSNVEPLANSSVAPDGADHLVAGDVILVQYVSRPMLPGIVFTSGSHTIKYAIQCLESNAGNNLFLQLFASVVSRDGGTVQATIRSKVADATEMATTLTNRTNSSTLSAGYTTVAGDRLVIELSATGTPTGAGGVQGHNATIRVGSNGTSGDLAENDTETGTTFNGWIEFSNDIFFEPLTGIVMMPMSPR